jgi:putative transposase
LYFVTCCTFRRRPLLATKDVHATFVEFGQRAQLDVGVAVGRYVILPDHLHFFVAIPEDDSLGKWVGSLKRALGRRTQLEDSSNPIWQRGFFDHVLRNEESYSEKWQYVYENPVRAGLVEKASDWPYGGELISIRYH